LTGRNPGLIYLPIRAHHPSLHPVRHCKLVQEASTAVGLGLPSAEDQLQGEVEPGEEILPTILEVVAVHASNETASLTFLMFLNFLEFLTFLAFLNFLKFLTFLAFLNLLAFLNFLAFCKER
jgi:hypothetical protein